MKKNRVVGSLTFYFVFALASTSQIVVNSSFGNPLNKFQNAQQSDLNEFHSGNLSRSELAEILKYNEGVFYDDIKMMISNNEYSLLDRCNAAQRSLALIYNDPEPETLIKTIDNLLQNEEISDAVKTELGEYLFSHGVALLSSAGTSESSIQLSEILSRWMKYLEVRMDKNPKGKRVVAFYQTALRYALLIGDSTSTDQYIERGKFIASRMLSSEQFGESNQDRSEALGVFMHFYEAGLEVGHAGSSDDELKNYYNEAIGKLGAIPDLQARLIEDYLLRGDFEGDYQKALFLEEHLGLLSASKNGKNLVYWLHSFYANRGDKLNMLRVQKIINKSEHE